MSPWTQSRPSSRAEPNRSAGRYIPPRQADALARSRRRVPQQQRATAIRPAQRCATRRRRRAVRPRPGRREHRRDGDEPSESRANAIEREATSRTAAGRHRARPARQPARHARSMPTQPRRRPRARPGGDPLPTGSRSDARPSFSASVTLPARHWISARQPSPMPCPMIDPAGGERRAPARDRAAPPAARPPGRARRGRRAAVARSARRHRRAPHPASARRANATAASAVPSHSTCEGEGAGCVTPRGRRRIPRPSPIAAGRPPRLARSIQGANDAELAEEQQLELRVEPSPPASTATSMPRVGGPARCDQRIHAGGDDLGT